MCKTCFRCVCFQCKFVFLYCLYPQLEQGLLFPRSGRRGRKRKEEKMAEIAMAEALARRQTARALSVLESGRFPIQGHEKGSMYFSGLMADFAMAQPLAKGGNLASLDTG